MLNHKMVMREAIEALNTKLALAEAEAVEAKQIHKSDFSVLFKFQSLS